MQHRCPECEQLWHQYATATTIHVQLENKLRFAALQNDPDQIETLTRQTETAEKVRMELRESIRKHEGSHESGPVQAAYHCQHRSKTTAFSPVL
jgi:hypothetical protein